MTKKTLCAAAALLLLGLTASAQKIIKLKPQKSIAIAIPEPSDICYNPKTDTFFIVSDNGILFETDHDQKIIRKVAEKDADFEAVYADGQFVYAVDETHRNIYRYDETLNRIGIANVPFSGGRNRGYEAITFNKSKNSFLLLTEKDPITLFELDANFKITNQIDLSRLARDISGATYYNDFLWLLSDESMRLIKLNPATYEVLGQWSLPVINPEGIAFDKDGTLLVTCDDMQRIYYFNNPEKN
jgi:uncharacterized protein YjiK